MILMPSSKPESKRAAKEIQKYSDKPKISQYNILAEKNMFEYFSSVNIIDKILQLRNKSSNYDFSNHTSY
jgi:hypothetical protein